MKRADKLAKCLSVVERYFDVDVDCADAAYDVLVDNDCDPETSMKLAREMYPE